MPVQQNSRTDWRWRVVRDQNSTQPAAQQWLLTTPNANLTVNAAAIPDFFPSAYKRAPTWGISVRSQFEVTGRSHLLDGQDVVYGAPGQVPTYDWQVPTGYASRLKFPLSNRGFVQGTPPLLLAAPFSQLDWPVPKGYRRAPDLRGFVQPSPLIILAVPFSQLDWPVPKAARRGVSLRGFVFGMGEPLYQLFEKPFLQNDWPLPPHAYPRSIALRWTGPQLLPAIYPFIEAHPARYAPTATADARYAPQTDASGRYAPTSEYNARYAPQTESDARYD